MAHLGFTISADNLQWQPAALTPLANPEISELQTQLSCHLLRSLPLATILCLRRVPNHSAAAYQTYACASPVNDEPATGA